MRLEIDATVRRGTFTLQVQTTIDTPACGVFGPSGAGKSTLLALVAGLVRPQAGRVVLDGVVFDDVASAIHVPPHRRRLGVVFQHGHLLPHLSVESNLRYGERLVPDAGRRVSFDEVVRLIEIGDLLTRVPRTLSGGQRQRVALGRALLCSPRLLLMDEPLAALDRGLKRQILPYLRRVRDTFAMPILHVSHDLPELLHVCDELLLVADGRSLAQGPLGRIAGDPGLLPLLHDAGMVNVLRGTVLAHADGMTSIALEGGSTAFGPRREEAAGSRVELLLRPDDVALALRPVDGISLQNQIPGTVLRVTAASDRVLVTVDIGQEVLVEVSGRTVAQLGLQAGREVCILFKAMALSGRA
ncbi:MAG: molybdenum ABC transporter ATP-binding protein [Planctomycetes bacterium]|nr:molybdenum ABC transporter ATP-binding protein [Planctomycetota bacterium]